VLDQVRRGAEGGEDLGQLRGRVARVFDVAASSSKALTVARTESSNFMNDVREAMFDKQGFERRDWVTAGDEHVRADHVTFGEAGPMPAGFNYMELVGGGDGSLTYPGDPEGPADQVIN